MLLPAERASTSRLLATCATSSPHSIFVRHRSTQQSADRRLREQLHKPIPDLKLPYGRNGFLNRLSREDFSHRRLQKLHAVQDRSLPKPTGRHGSERRWTRNQTGVLTLVPKKLDAASRNSLISNGGFIAWLEERLEALSKSCKNASYASFIKNFKTTIRTQRLKQAVEKYKGDGRRQTSSPDDWRPLEFKSPSALLKALEDSFRVSGETAVDLQLRYSYEGTVANRRFSDVTVETQVKLADLRYPVEWYPATRTIQRTIHLHVGPTNSGKTYQALKRLEQAESGVYAGPLRLLAHEVYQRLNAKGKTCDLVTGDEIITRNTPSDGPGMQSCTVEMIPLNTTFDVAVIDEIQMMGHQQRGWAWTQALLGLKARELHLCGEERTVPLVRELVALMGDKLEIHTYQRLSPLKTASTSLRGGLQDLRKGDCVVVFSRIGLHAMKRDIERATQKRVAIIYGGLPPEIRAQQAKLFNDPDSDYEVLVASDAIGMGLNLAIKRIIFSAVQKYNGATFEVLKTHEIKQIAGRAGRFRTATQDNLESTRPSTNSSPGLPSANLGMVTTLEDADLPILRRAMQAREEPITRAGILPPTSILIEFAAFFPPSTNFSYILLRLHEIALIHPRFSLTMLDPQVKIADAIQSVENLSTNDRIIFCNSPADLKRAGMATIVATLARCVGDRTSGALLDIPDIHIEALDEAITMDGKYLDRLETLHSSLVLYLWLSYRFAGVFINQAMAFYVKSLVEERIDKILTEYSASAKIRAKIQKMREEATRQLQRMALQSSDQSSVDENNQETADQLSIKDELEGEDSNSQVLPQLPIAETPDSQELTTLAN